MTRNGLMTRAKARVRALASGVAGIRVSPFAGMDPEQAGLYSNDG